MGMAGLAGILSLGEERRSGTHAWQMTLPISSRRQWLIKFIIAMLAGLACSLLLPALTMIASGAFFGSPLLYVHLGALRDELIAYPILTFACFWCACAANGSVRASIWAMPVTAAIPLASYSGIWLGRGLARDTGALKDLAISAMHLSPFAFSGLTAYAREHILWLFYPALLVALLQSYRLFRAQPRDGTVWMLRCLALPAAVTILWSLVVTAGFTSSTWQPFDETRRALDRFHAGAAKIELMGEDLANASPMTSLTRRWLEGSRIAVAPDNSGLSAYRARIHLSSGLECKLIVTRYGGTAASCNSKAP
jgi:hypothetical protein